MDAVEKYCLGCTLIRESAVQKVRIDKAVKYIEKHFCTVDEGYMGKQIIKILKGETK